MPLTESDILQRHAQSLREAHGACQKLGLNADPDYLAPRGHLYTEVKQALEHLEGSCRQMAAFRSDSRWVRLGVIYAIAMRGAQKAMVGQRWAWFSQLMPLFENGARHMDDLRDARTGRLSREAILPQNSSSWLVMPDSKPALRPPVPRRDLN